MDMAAMAAIYRNIENMFKTLGEIQQTFELYELNLQVVAGQDSGFRFGQSYLKHIMKPRYSALILKIKDIVFLVHPWDIGQRELCQMMDIVKARVALTEEDRGVLETIEDVKKTGEQLYVECQDLMQNFKRAFPENIPFKETRRELNSLAFLYKEAGNGEWPEERLELSHVAEYFYGFSADIGREIEKKLLHKTLLDYDAGPDHWKIYEKVQRDIQDLKKRLYGPQDDTDEVPNPLALTLSLLKVIRNAIFHSESVLCNLMHDIYYIMSGNASSEVLFQEFRDKLENMKETKNGMVPISVSKILCMFQNPILLTPHGAEMMGYPILLNADGDPTIRMPIITKTGREELHETMQLGAVLQIFYKLIKGLRPTGDGIRQWVDDMELHLILFEEQLKEIEGIIRRAKFGDGEQTDGLVQGVADLGVE